MSNISDLKAAYIAEAADVSDAIDKLECLSAIDSWYACELAVSTLSSSDVSSYSIAGRSVTRKNLSELQTQAKDYKQQFLFYLGRAGGSALADLRSPDYEGNP
jgi:hypothetical protein